MATTYTGYFNSIHDKTYKVQITVNKGNATKSITLGGDPFITTQEGSSETLYAPIKSSGASIQILQYGLDYIEDFYAANAHHAKVELFGPNNVLAWRGWVQPCIYDQSWVTQTEVLEVTANASLSTLEYYKWDGTESKMSFLDIINSILTKAQGVDYFCFPTNMTVKYGSLIEELYITTKNFCGEDDKDENWTLKEVLSEICQYLSLSAVEDYGPEGCTVYFLDYDAIKNNSNYYYRYRVGSGARDEQMIVRSSTVPITGDKFMSANTNLSLDQVFNKVTVSTSTRKIESEMPALGESDYMTPVSNYTSGDDFFGETLYLYNWPGVANRPSITLAGWYNGVQWIYDEQWKKMVWEKFYTNKNFVVYDGWRLTQDDYNYWGAASAGERVSLPQTYDATIAKMNYNSSGQYTSTDGYVGAWIIKQDVQDATEGTKNEFFKRIASVSMKDYILLESNRYSSKPGWTTKGIGKPGDYYDSTNPTTPQPKVVNASTEAIEPTQKLCTWKGIFNAPISTHTNFLLNFKATYYARQQAPFKLESEDDASKTSKYLDFIWVQIKIGDYYVTGEYTTPGGQHYGYIGWNYDRNEPSDSLANANYTFSRTPGYLRLYYQMQDEWIGRTMNLNSNIEWRDGVESTEGVMINLDIDNAFINGVQEHPYAKFGDEIEVSFFRPHALSDHYLGGCLISDFKATVERSTLDDLAKDKDDTATVYTIDVDESYSVDGPEQSNKITTYDGKAVSYSDVLLEDGTYLDEVYNRAFPQTDEIPNNKTRLEWWSCWRTKKQYQEPRVVLTLDIKDDGVKPYSTFTNMGKTFIGDSIGHDFRLQTVNLKIIEKA